MNQTQQAAGRAACWTKAGLPWVLALMLSTGVAYMMNAAAVRALSTDRPYEAISTVAQDVSNLCALDVDGALYVGFDWWLPGGRTAFCRADTYPGIPGRNDIATQLARAGPLQATITFVAPNGIRIALYCPTSSQQLSAEANLVSAAEARMLYGQVCASAGSRE